MELPSAIPAFVEALARSVAEAASKGDVSKAGHLAAQVLFVLAATTRRGP
jgi:hypothetical protein